MTILKGGGEEGVQTFVLGAENDWLGDTMASRCALYNIYAFPNCAFLQHCKVARWLQCACPPKRKFLKFFDGGCIGGRSGII